jgi:hypothetical protein
MVAIHIKDGQVQLLIMARLVAHSMVCWTWVVEISGTCRSIDLRDNPPRQLVVADEVTVVVEVGST